MWPIPPVGIRKQVRLVVLVLPGVGADVLEHPRVAFHELPDEGDSRGGEGPAGVRLASVAQELLVALVELQPQTDVQFLALLCAGWKRREKGGVRYCLRVIKYDQVTTFIIVK